MKYSFTTSLLAATVAGLATAPPQIEFHTGTRRWAHLRVSMDQYTTYYFDNQIDHFDEGDERTYKQRYWYNDKFFDQDSGPVFLYICGEWTCTPPDEQMFPMLVGADHKALLMSLEHRYYGDSQPFEDWSTPNLKYLTSEQALADIAQFIDAQNKAQGREADWIVIGGSYPGALAAWFKSQYPKHAVGAWSSSGVIHAIDDFKAFDKDLYDRAMLNNDQCPVHVRDVVDHIAQEFKTEEGTKRVCETFGIDESTLDKRDFQFYLADIFTTGIQYGNRVTMCNDFYEASGSIESLMDAVAKFGAGAGVTYDLYWHKALQDTTIDINKAYRQWTYEYCTQFAFFQTPNDVFPMRSEELELPFWSYYCKAIFGDDIGEPAVERVNKHYGGLDIMGDNIFFLNGSEDPWQYAAMTEIKHPQTTQRTMQAAYIECDTCGHCVDFHTPTDGQPEALTRAQHQVADTVAKWLKEAQETREATTLEDVAFDEVLRDSPLITDQTFINDGLFIQQ